VSTLERTFRGLAGLLIAGAFAVLAARLVFSTRSPPSVLKVALGWMGAFVGVGIWLILTALLPTLVSGPRLLQADTTLRDLQERLDPWFIGIPWTCGWALIGLTKDHEAWALAALPVSFCLAAIVHELGHASAGALLGIRLLSVQVGRVRLHLRPLRLRWIGRQFIGGLVQPAPEIGALPRWRQALFILGGPAASVACAAVVLTWALQSPSPVRPFLGAAGFASALAGIIALTPWRMTDEGMPSDGLALLKLLRRSAPQLLATQILALTAAGKRPREWHVSLERLAEAAAKDGGWTTLFAYELALDTGSTEQARVMLERGLATSADHPEIRTDVLLQAAMFYALIDADPERARAALPLQLANTEPWYPLLAHAAVLAAEGRLDEARAARGAWLTGVEATPKENRALRIGGNEWVLDDLARRLDVERSA
jgi:hypothetical protein